MKESMDPKNIQRDRRFLDMEQVMERCERGESENGQSGAWTGRIGQMKDE